MLLTIGSQRKNKTYYKITNLNYFMVKLLYPCRDAITI